MRKSRREEPSESEIWRQHEKLMRGHREKEGQARKQVLQPQLDALMACGRCQCYNPINGHHRIFTAEGCFDVWPKRGTVWDISNNRTQRGVDDLREIPVLARLLDDPLRQVERIHNERIDNAVLASAPLPPLPEKPPEQSREHKLRPLREPSADDRPPWEE